MITMIITIIIVLLIIIIIVIIMISVAIIMSMFIISMIIISIIISSSMWYYIYLDNTTYTCSHTCTGNCMPRGVVLIVGLVIIRKSRCKKCCLLKARSRGWGYFWISSRKGTCMILVAILIKYIITFAGRNNADDNERNTTTPTINYK